MSLQVDSVTRWPLAVVRLAELADDVVPAGGDLDPADIHFARPDLLVLAGPDRDTTLEFGLSYRIAANAEALEFTSLLSTDDLGLSIARGSIAYRPDRRLALTGEVGPAAMPRRRYEASDVSPSATYVIRIRRQSVGLREKVVVLVVTAVLAGLAAFWVSRSGEVSSN